MLDRQPLLAQRKLTIIEKFLLLWGGGQGMLKNMLIAAFICAVTADELADEAELIGSDTHPSPYFIAALTIAVVYEMLQFFEEKRLSENDFFDRQPDAGEVKRISNQKIISAGFNRPAAALKTLCVGLLPNEEVMEEKLGRNIEISCSDRVNLILGAILGLIKWTILAAAPVAVEGRELSRKISDSLTEEEFYIIFMIALGYGLFDAVEMFFLREGLTAEDINMSKDSNLRFLSMWALSSSHPFNAIKLAVCHKKPAEIQRLSMEDGSVERSGGSEGKSGASSMVNPAGSEAHSSATTSFSPTSLAPPTIDTSIRSVVDGPVGREVKSFSSLPSFVEGPKRLAISRAPESSASDFFGRGDESDAQLKGGARKRQIKRAMLGAEHVKSIPYPTVPPGPSFFPPDPSFNQVVEEERPQKRILLSQETRTITDYFDLPAIVKLPAIELKQSRKASTETETFSSSKRRQPKQERIVGARSNGIW